MLLFLLLQAQLQLANNMLQGQALAFFHISEMSVLTVAYIYQYGIRALKMLLDPLPHIIIHAADIHHNDVPDRLN